MRLSVIIVMNFSSDDSYYLQNTLTISSIKFVLMKNEICT